MTFVGLTDNPDKAKTAHGKPSDWVVFPFDTENEACQWEIKMRGKCHHIGHMVTPAPVQRTSYQYGPKSQEEQHAREMAGSRRKYGYTFTVSKKCK